MNRIVLIFGWAFFCFQEIGANEEADAIEVSPLDRAIEMLASDSFHEREAASKALWEFGEEAVEALEAASKSLDPEVAHRARILWDRIRTGVGPDTPSEIVALVQKYAQNGRHEKRKILESLSRLKAYPQILRLYHFEEDEKTQKACREIVNESVLPAVRLALASGNQEEAIKLLRIAPPSDENLRRLAALYRDTGQIEDILAELRDRRDLAELPLLLACLRVNGELGEAIAVAKELERDDIVGALEILNGNPVPYVQWRIEERSVSSLERLHLEIVLENWYGNRKQAARLVRPMINMAKNGEEDNTRALRSILLNGSLEDAISIMTKEHEMALFSYFEIMENPWAALNLLGYSRKAQEKTRWVQEHLEFLQKEWDFHSSEMNSYFSVAALLYQRGAEAEGLSLVRSVMHAAQEAGGEHWEDFIDYIGGQGRIFTEMGFLLLSEGISPETDEEEVREYLVILTGIDKSGNAIWQALGQKEGLDLKRRFIAYAKLYGLLPASEEELDELWTFLLECAEGKRESNVTYLLLFQPASYRGDTQLMLKLLETLSETEPDEIFDINLANYYSFHHRWEDSEKKWAELMPDNGVGNRYLGSYAGVLWRLDRKAEARAVLERITQKNLDDPLLLKSIAVSLESNGVWNLAAEYWRKILLTTEPTSRHWIHAVEKLTRSAKVGEDWRLASALAMVQSAVGISGDTAENSPVFNLRRFFFMNFYKALDEFEEGKDESAKERLEDGFSVLVGDGILADDFFPILRKQGHIALHDGFFERAYARFSKAIEDFPNAHNSRNGAAWLASRAARRLDEAEAHVARALEIRPRQAAYLDTMAEVWFARHDRQEAIKWSKRSLTDSQYAGHNTEGGAELRAQHDRFLTGEFPPR